MLSKGFMRIVYFFIGLIVSDLGFAAGVLTPKGFIAKQQHKLFFDTV